jgi:hypothetical protein
MIVRTQKGRQRTIEGKSKFKSERASKFVVGLGSLREDVKVGWLVLGGTNHFAKDLAKGLGNRMGKLAPNKAGDSRYFSLYAEHDGYTTAFGGM